MLRAQLARLRRMTFGTSSEKLAQEIAQLDLALEEYEAEADSADAQVTSGEELKQRNELGGFALNLRLMPARYQQPADSATWSDKALGQATASGIQSWGAWAPSRIPLTSARPSATTAEGRRSCTALSSAISVKVAANGTMPARPRCLRI